MELLKEMCLFFVSNLAEGQVFLLKNVKTEQEVKESPYENLVSVRYLLIRILDSNALVSNKQSVTYLLHGG